MCPFVRLSFQEYKISKFDTSTQKRAIAKTDMLKFTETSQPIGQKNMWS